MTYLQTSKLRNLFLLLSVLALVAVSCGTDSGTDGDATEATSAATEATSAATEATSAATEGRRPPPRGRRPPPQRPCQAAS